MAKCPHGCPGGMVIYKCNKCGEIRCSHHKCPGMNNSSGNAHINSTCKSCKKGKYEKL